MKPFQVILIFILAIVLIIIMVRSCQDDYVIEPEQEETTEPDASSDESPFIPPFVLEEDTDSISSSTNPSIWPDSIFAVVSNANYLSQIDKDVIVELNKCRTNPSRYAKEALVPFLNKMSSSGVYVNSEGLNIRTSEGKSAVQEAIDALNSQSPLNMLRPKQYLCLAATDHCKDQGPQSLVGHGGSDGSSPMSRVRRHNPKCRGVGENIDYGSSTGAEIILSLVVDDGVPDRGHRDNIFHDYKYVGTAFGPHKGFRYMCVLDFE